MSAAVRPAENWTGPRGWALSPAVAGRAATAGAALLLAGVFLYAHAWYGLRHDSKLYTFLALARLDPAAFGRDLFVAYGSQDQYTLFTPVYAWTIARLGIDGANIVLMLTGSALWLSGIWALVRRFTRGWSAIAAVALTAVVPATYGAFGVFHAAEGFLTPRLFAEALTLHALAARGWRPVPLFALALACHPLMALPGVSVALATKAFDQPRWWAVFGAALVAGMGLAALGVAPFDQLFRDFDPTWRAAVEGRATELFPSGWREVDWLGLGVALTAVIVAGRSLSGARRRLLLAVALAGAAGPLLTLLVGDLWGSVLVISAQPWRAAWLAQALVPAALVILGAKRHKTPLTWVGIAAATLGLLNIAQLSITVLPLLALGGVAAGAAFLLRRSPALLLAVGLPVFAAAAAGWDSRAGWGQRLAEGPLPIAASLPAGAEVLWGDDAQQTWLLLHRRAWVSLTQGAGLVFSRPMALDYWHRIERADGLVDPARPFFPRKVRACTEAERIPTAAEFRRLCAPGGPDVVVLNAAIPGIPATAFTTPAPREDLCADGETPRKTLRSQFFLHDCREVR